MARGWSIGQAREEHFHHSGKLCQTNLCGILFTSRLTLRKWKSSGHRNLTLMVRDPRQMKTSCLKFSCGLRTYLRVLKSPSGIWNLTSSKRWTNWCEGHHVRGRGKGRAEGNYELAHLQMPNINIKAQHSVSGTWMDEALGRHSGYQRVHPQKPHKSQTDMVGHSRGRQGFHKASTGWWDG